MENIGSAGGIWQSLHRRGRPFPAVPAVLARHAWASRGCPGHHAPEIRWNHQVSRTYTTCDTTHNRLYRNALDPWGWHLHLHNTQSQRAAIEQICALRKQVEAHDLGSRLMRKPLWASVGGDGRRCRGDYRRCGRGPWAAGETGEAERWLRRAGRVAEGDEPCPGGRLWSRPRAAAQAAAKDSRRGGRCWARCTRTKADQGGAWQSSSGSSPRRRGRLARAREGRWSKGKRAAAAWGTGAKVRGCRAAGGSNTAVAAGAAAVGGCGGAAARPSAARPRSRARTSAPHHLARVRVKGEGEGEGGWASGLGSGLALGLARHMSLDWQAQPERGAGSNPKS